MSGSDAVPGDASSSIGGGVEARGAHDPSGETVEPGASHVLSGSALGSVTAAQPDMLFLSFSDATRGLVAAASGSGFGVDFVDLSVALPGASHAGGPTLQAGAAGGFGAALGQAAGGMLGDFFAAMGPAVPGGAMRTEASGNAGGGGGESQPPPIGVPFTLQG